jgi:hypothetical protein
MSKTDLSMMMIVTLVKEEALTTGGSIFIGKGRGHASRPWGWRVLIK